MMHRRVVLSDSYGDTRHGVEKEIASDFPNVITAGPTCWTVEVWAARGWSVCWTGDWEW